MKLFFVLFFSLLANFVSAEDSKKLLTIYVSETFIKDWMQTGDPVKRAFEFSCNCKVKFVVLSDIHSALSRVILEGKNSPADLIVGLEMSMLAKAKKTGLFAPIDVPVTNLKLPFQWTEKYFIPYDYAYLAFIYNSKRVKNPPKSFTELVDREDLKIALQDPRSSPTGSDFLTWINLLYKDKALQAWTKLKKKVLSFTRGWSESYSMFLFNEVDMVLSYNTSPVYHLMAENNSDYKAIEFEEGNYLQVELIGKLKNSKNSELADKFIAFALSKSFQRLIPINNFMLPVIDLESDMPDEYRDVFIPKKYFLVNEEELDLNHKLWIKEWLEALSKD